jgi:hypothetical protein
MNAYLKNHLDVLDSLLHAGDAGQPLRPEHVPHLGSLCGRPLTTIGHKTVSRSRIEVALPPVILSDYCHVAEVDVNSQRICYKRILNQHESEACSDLLFLREAQTYVREYWSAKLHADSVENCIITQTRSDDKSLEWKISTTSVDNTGSTPKNSACKIESITRQSQFMELARVARVDYTD